MLHDQDSTNNPNRPASDPGDTACIEYDVLVYGGTAGGLIAALAAGRAGAAVTVLEPGRHLRGSTSSGSANTMA